MMNGMFRSHHVVWVMLSSALVVGCACSCREIPATDLREVMRRELCDFLNVSTSDGRMQSANDIPHALSMFDDYIAPNLEERHGGNRKTAMRRQIEDGKSWMYYNVFREDDDLLCCYLVNLFPSCDSGEYGFYFWNSIWNKTKGRFNHPKVESRGFLTLQPQNKEMGFFYSDSYYEEFCNKLPRLIDAVDDWDVNTSYEFAEISAIVDVVDVQLVGVTGMNYSRNRYCYPGCRAEYRIRLDVRSVERGELPSENYILVRKPFWYEFGFDRRWIYYRGMTLRIALHVDDKGGVNMVEALPVEPYYPYANENVRVNGGARDRGSDAGETEGGIEPLVIEYGAHTKVQFQHGDTVTSGRQGVFFDFGVTSKFKILELSNDANREYWENLWFAPGGGR